MSGFSMDFEHLNEIVNPQRTRYSFERHGHLFKKVAFDMYKPINSATNQLWELREEEGGQYLYAVYDEPEDIVANSNDEQVWKTEADNEGENVTLSYKNVPVYRFSSKVYPFRVKNANEFADYIQKKATNPKWIEELLSNAPGITDERRKAIRKLLDGDQ